MASAQRAPRDVLLQTDAEYQRLAEQHQQYEAELQRISKSPYLNSEDLLEEIKLKKMKLHCKDRSEEHTSELQSLAYLVCRLLLEKKKTHGRGRCACIVITFQPTYYQ